jgi:hypothetical protein
MASRNYKLIIRANLKFNVISGFEILRIPMHKSSAFALRKFSGKIIQREKLCNSTSFFLMRFATYSL